MHDAIKIASAERGFTLVELLVVLLIVGMMASVAVLSIPQDGGALDKDAQQFAVRTAALRDNAILQSRPMAVQITPSGYAFLQRREGAWQRLEDRPFTATDWSTGVVPQLAEGQALEIAFESTGLVPEAGNVALRYGDAVRVVAIAPTGEVKLVGQGE